MSGQTIATVYWRALDKTGDDTCRLARVDHGWLLIGHARFHDADGHAALDYVVRCDTDWHTLSADVAGKHGGRDIKLALHRERKDWEMNHHAQPQVHGALDIDLSFTPATNLMPLRRLASGTQSSISTRAAWLRYPSCELAPLDQVYTRFGRSDTVSYTAQQTGYATQLRCDPGGFVTLYPDAWEGEVSHAAS